MDYLKYEVNDAIAYITLNRPEKRNAFSYHLVTELKQAFSEAADNDAVKVVVLKAEGPAFCAGADLDYLKSLQGLTYEENLADSTYLKDLYLQIYRLPKVVIGAVQGHAIAGGCGLVSVCDFVFSVPEASFGYTEVRIGFVPAIVMTFLLRKIGEARSREMLISGNLISAATAREYGIVNEIVSAEELLTKVETFARSLCKNNSANSMALTKQMIADIQEMPLASALSYAAEMNARSRLSKDWKTGVDAFLNKNKITW